MAHVATVSPLHFGLSFTENSVRTGPGFFSRLLEALGRARQEQAEREIAVYLSTCGGKFTDEGEREIERRFLGSGSQW